MFPAFINDTAIDWFFTWPQDALEEVATTFLASADLEVAGRDAMARACSHVHMDAIREAEAFRQVAKRTSYITPTKFLRLVTVRLGCNPDMGQETYGRGLMTPILMPRISNQYVSACRDTVACWRVRRMACTRR